MDERTDTDMGKELLAMLLEAARGAPATTLLLAASALAVLALLPLSGRAVLRLACVVAATSLARAAARIPSTRGGTNPIQS